MRHLVLAVFHGDCAAAIRVRIRVRPVFAAGRLANEPPVILGVGSSQTNLLEISPSRRRSDISTSILLTLLRKRQRVRTESLSSLWESNGCSV